MANNVTNIIELRGKPERVQELLNAIGNDEYGSGSISFEKIIPMPGNLYMGAISRDGTLPYAKNNWLDWSLANWGSKWDAYGFDNRPKETPDSTLWFLSANQPPHPVIQHLSEMFPDVVMEHLWADANLGYGCGTCTYKAGQKIEECHPDYGRRAYEFSAKVLGVDLAEMGYVLTEEGTDYIHRDFLEVQSL